MLLLLLVGAVIFAVNQSNRSGSPGTQVPTQASTQAAIAQESIGKPELVAKTFRGCPASGDGGDPHPEHPQEPHR